MKIVKWFIFLFIVFFVQFTISSTYVIDANEDTNSLHAKTKIYSQNSEGFYNGCEEISRYDNVLPTITVFTPGLDSADYFWSNNQYLESKETFGFNYDSLIYKLLDRLMGEANMYIINTSTTLQSVESSTYDQINVIENINYQIVKYPTDNYLDSSGGYETSRIDNASRHIVLIYNSCISGESNSNIYQEFEYILDSISYQYKQLTGLLPKFNLIGHSRGGLTNIMYATDHPHNVDSIYTLATPFSGSALGEIDALLDFMGYLNSEGVVNSEGVKSIMNDAEMKEIRNAWNDVYTSDVHINVNVYGAMTSISLLRTLLEDLQNNSEYVNSYGSSLVNYKHVIETIINIADRNPNLLTNTLNFINGVAEITSSLDINLYNEVLEILDVDIVGGLETDEVGALISLVNVINGEFVIMDDLFVDLDSQLGMGFDDGISYNGFKKYVKIFRSEDYTNNRSEPSEPGIPHNLETMNAYLTNDIMRGLVLGVPSENVTILHDKYESLCNVSNGKVFRFEPEATGIRKIYAAGCDIILYSYDSHGSLVLIDNYVGEAVYNFVKNKKYLFVVENQNIVNVNIKFTVSSELFDGSNSIYISSNDYIVYKFASDVSGYYMITCNNSNIELNGDVISLERSKCWVYAKANEDAFIYIKNTSNEERFIDLVVSDIHTLEMEQQYVINSDKKVVKFTNENDFSVSYKLEITWNVGTEYACIYDQNNNMIATVYSDDMKNIYSFTLSSNEVCFIIFSNDNFSITADLYVNETQMRWEIDGEIYDSTNVCLARGKSYYIRLLIIIGDDIFDSDSEFNTGTQNNYTLSNNILTISESAMIGYDITIMPLIDYSYVLTVKVGLTDDDILWIEENNDQVYISWENIDDFENLVVTLSNSAYSNSFITQETNEENRGKFHITDFLPLNLGKTTIHIVSFTLNGYHYENGENIFITDYVIDNLFDSGEGNINNPYKITCERHLNNIRYAGSLYIDESGEHTYLQKNFIISSNISLVNNWEPINITMKSGSIVGIEEGIIISGLKIEEIKGNQNIGFIRNVHGGTISNICFSNVDIKVINSIENTLISVGVVAGSATGATIENCTILSGNISIGTADDSIDLIGARYTFTGGICGMGQYVYDCNNNCSIFSHGDIGGICCYILGGIIDNCNNHGNLILFHNNQLLLSDTENKSLGGIIGIAYGVEILNCENEGDLRYESKGYVNDVNLAPRIGWLAGRIRNSSTEEGIIVNRGVAYAKIYTTNLQSVSYGCAVHNQDQYTKLNIGKID